MAATHYIPAFTSQNGRKRKTVCGTYVTVAEHSAEPTCEPCAAYLRDENRESSKFNSVEDRAIALFGESDPAAPRVGSTPYFDPVSGYRPKGTRAARNAGIAEPLRTLINDFSKGVTR